MPIFDFYCEECKKTLEKLVKLDTTQIICDTCKSTCKKLSVPQPTNFILKGSDWYKNDNRKDKKQ